MTRVGIIGGGPGGLLTARLLERAAGGRLDVTVYEASGRVGGKLDTRAFPCGSRYEAGAAECYDHTALGPDPLIELIQELGLGLRPIEGAGTWFEGRMVPDLAGSTLPGRAAAEVARFRDRAQALLPLERWHPDDWRADAAHPWLRRSGAALLDDVEDETARRYLETMLHSDLATEPHRTNGLTVLKNAVLDLPGYVQCRALEGGMGRLADALEQGLQHTRIRRATRVRRVEQRPGARFRLHLETEEGAALADEDVLFAALPLTQLGSVDWTGTDLAPALRRHVARHDHPAHYLRVTLCCERPFWRDRFPGSWFMLDAFGGACAYDESRRLGGGDGAVLGVLLAGSAALAGAAATRAELTRRVLDALPADLARSARRHLLGARVHRWTAGVSGLPGGLVPRDPARSHQPDRDRLPTLLLVGDYLFDSTLNGVCQSAAVASRLYLEEGAAVRARTAA